MMCLKLTVELGNKSSALPFTVILDRNGSVAHSKTGKLSEAEAGSCYSSRCIRPGTTKPHSKLDNPHRFAANSTL